tara:strand:+ start:633 stop:1289 length:657 start_codon:yes stop_codon:yes gene_type:complete
MQHANSIELWGAHTARTFRPIWVAEELELDYTLYPLAPRSGELQTPEYIQLNPRQKIPYMRDGELEISESLAISRYLVNAYGNQTLSTPSSPAEIAKEDAWCCYTYGELDETSLYVIRRHRDLAEIYGGSETVVQSCFDYLNRHLNVIENHLKGHQYVIEKGFSLADIMLQTCLTWAEDYGAELGKECKRYISFIGERPAYQRARHSNYTPQEQQWIP